VTGVTERAARASVGPNRRIVTGLGPDGHPAILADGPATRAHTHTATPGMVNTLVWKTTNPPRRNAADPTLACATFVPEVGETIALLVSFPPDAVFSDPSFDAAAAAAENRLSIPGLADLFEPDAPGMHTTPSVDYAVVVQGEVMLDLGTESTTVRQGEFVIQNGTRHAWRNTTDEPATVFFVLVGAAEHEEGER
jgi:mannose-6-phosphate isomerase-like protein (cupin superfamily)